MSARIGIRFALCALALFPALPADAASLVIRNARVHTADTAGTLARADVLVEGGVVRAVAAGAVAPAGAAEVDAGGKALTPGLFAGLTAIGLEEVGLEAATVDQNFAPGAQQPALELAWRPEFDVAPAYNPRSVLVPVARIDGLAWTMLAPGSLAGGNFVAGQGAVAVLDGRYDVQPGTQALFVNLGSGSAPLAGGSRAAQYMLLEQAIAEARAPAQAGDEALLTAAGRKALVRYLGGGRVVFGVHRAADIRRVLELSRRHGFAPIIAGGAESWVLARELAAADVPVLIDPLANLPADFDRLGARADAAALLHAAGVTVVFTQSGDASHNARKIRQLAGNAVAQGMPWEAALAALTANPAKVFGLADRGRIAPGMRADLVLWSGDPLEVTSMVERAWIDGAPVELRSRQTELRDRYRPRAGR